MPYIQFTDEQKVLANSVDLEQFLRMRGEKLERVGREHKLIRYGVDKIEWKVCLMRYHPHSNNVHTITIKK